MTDLRHILDEITETRKAFDAARGDIAADINDRLATLSDEARAMIAERLGVSWDAVARACL